MTPSRPQPEYSSLVRDVLLAGPADGQQILQDAQTNNLWQALYTASKSSPYALEWRQAFGRGTVSYSGSTSILGVAVKMLIDYADSQEPNPSPETSDALIKLIANCCADNNQNRRLVLQAGGLLSLVKILVEGEDSTIVIPTIYNVCADFDEPAHTNSDHTSEDHLHVTLAEERLARADVPSFSIFSGIQALLKPYVVLDCEDGIKEYLAELVEMAARPAAALEGNFEERDCDYDQAIERLLALDGGQYVADYSARARAYIVRSLFAISASSAAKTYLASTGSIFQFALAADTPDLMPGYYGEDEEEQKDNIETMTKLQTTMLSMVYEICRMPEFTDPPKYGVARQSLDILCHSVNISPFQGTIAYIMLYAFINSDARAHLLATEDLIPALFHTLKYETDKTIIHPALAVATKLAVTWSLRRHLFGMRFMQAVHHLLTRQGLGYEIPTNAVTFLELMIKGHPEHIPALLVTTQHHDSIMSDLFKLFDKGQDTIRLEIGRLIVELCATIAQQTSSAPTYSELFNLDAIIQLFPLDQWSKIFVFMATKAQIADPPVAQRVWFALGLLSTLNGGKQVVLQVLHNTDVQQTVRNVVSQPESYAGQNIRFMVHNMRNSGSDLNTVMNQLSLT
ncbi:hypothetical protein LTS08_003095 [Lithohypha guttulata]|nr:hypothetical protein LTS08_003095 [Lithohypha guttulata]